MNRNKIYFVSMSGGKDSTATAIYMLKNYPRNKLRFVFADTGWEHPETYKYLDYLEKRLNIRILKVKSKTFKDMETLCITKKMFPSRVRKFCTTELKIIPIQDLYNRYKAKGYKVVPVVGVRSEESKKREPEQLWKTNFTKVPQFKQWLKLKNISKSKSVKNYYNQENSITIYQPIVYWTTQQVYQYHYENKVELNPLYKMGCNRVGCYPCINANKFEIGTLNEEAIRKVRNLESKVQKVALKNKNSTFFYKRGVIPIDELYEKYKYNSLGLDIECINPYMVCE